MKLVLLCLGCFLVVVPLSGVMADWDSSQEDDSSLYDDYVDWNQGLLSQCNYFTIS